MEIQEIKKILKERKITYDKLADLTGLSKSCITKIFAGYAKYPRVDTIETIEKALGLDKEVVPGISEEEKELMELIKQLPNESTKELIEIIKQLSYDGTKELMAYADFLISKRK